MAASMADLDVRSLHRLHEVAEANGWDEVLADVSDAFRAEGALPDG